MAVIVDTSVLLEDFYVNTLGVKDPELLKQGLRYSFVQKCRQKEKVIRLGEVQDALYFIYRGIVRSYCINMDGEVDTDCICMEGDCLISMPNVDEPTASMCDFETLSPCILIGIPIEKATELKNTSMEACHICCRVLADYVRRYTVLKRLRNEMTDNRIRFVLETRPELFTRVQNQYIASLLGMNQSTFSRTLKKVLQDMNTSKRAFVQNVEIRLAEEEANASKVALEFKRARDAKRILSALEIKDTRMKNQDLVRKIEADAEIDA